MLQQTELAESLLLLQLLPAVLTRLLRLLADYICLWQTAETRCLQAQGQSHLQQAQMSTPLSCQITKHTADQALIESSFESQIFQILVSQLSLALTWLRASADSSSSIARKCDDTAEIKVDVWCAPSLEVADHRQVPGSACGIGFGQGMHLWTHRDTRDAMCDFLQESNSSKLKIAFNTLGLLTACPFKAACTCQATPEATLRV